MSDKTNPEHYKLHEHECIDEMLEVFGADAVKIFCVLNTWKYRYRAGSKTGESAADDNAKSDWYMNKLIELNKADEEESGKKSSPMGLVSTEQEIHSEVIYADH